MEENEPVKLEEVRLILTGDDINGPLHYRGILVCDDETMDEASDQIAQDLGENIVELRYGITNSN